MQETQRIAVRAVVAEGLLMIPGSPSVARPVISINGGFTVPDMTTSQQEGTK